MKNSPTTSKAEEKDIKRILQKYTKYWYLFLIGILICVTLAFLYLRYKAVPQYKITSTLLVKDKDKGAGSSELESFSDLGLIKPARNIEDEIGIITSSSLMEDVLYDMALHVNYYVEGNVDEVEVYGKHLPVSVVVDKSQPVSYGTSMQVYLKGDNNFELSWENAKGDVTTSSYEYDEVIKTPYATFTVVPNTEMIRSEIGNNIVFRFQNVQDLAELYSSQLTVEPVNETGSLIQISLLDPLPKRGEDIVRKLTEVYTQKAVDYKNQLAITTIGMIDDRLEILTGELTGVEVDVEQYKQRNDLTNVTSDAALYQERASEANSRLAEYETQIDVLNSIESYLSQRGDDSPLVPSSQNIQDPTLVGLISKFNELQLKRRSLLRTTPKENPLVVEIDQQLTDLRSNLLENLSNIKNGLIITRRNLLATSSRFESRVRKVPSAERELLAINREQSTKQELYLYLLQKREEEALSLVAHVSNTRIIDPPRAGLFPVSPNKTSIYLGAMIFGFFIPFSFVYIKERMNDKVQSTLDIEDYTNAPVLGEIAHNSEKKIIVATEKSNTPVAELFRLIRFNLKFVSAGKANKVIMVTSSMKGEGKTFFTINLGASLALSGMKVVILSFDLRAPKLIKDMGLTEQYGITDYLISPDIMLEEILIEAPNIKGLSVIGSGPIPPNAGELMLHPRIGELIGQLKERYDYVLIDTAPIGKVADAFALDPYIDSTIYIVRHNYTQKTQLRIIENIYQNNKLHYPMVVLNGTKSKEAYGYGYGQEEIRKKSRIVGNELLSDKQNYKRG